MDAWQALVLGVVEGITEYLPVSSTGHLLVAQRALGIGASEAANAFAICIQAGAIVAVLALYARRVGQMLRGLVGRDRAGATLAANLVVAFAPAAVLGVLFDDAIEQYLFGPWPVVAAWAVGGAAILALWRTRRFRAAAEGAALEALPWRVALAIGCAQALALWPGTSRSLVTIVAGVAGGLALPAAVEFSFLLGLLTLGAATGYKALQSGEALLAAFGPTTLVLGFLAAWLSALLSVRWMVGYLTRHGMQLFAWWRLTAAAIVAGLVLAGVL